jgi:septal ring factor EnvC (AmiA/AmiB activator)
MSSVPQISQNTTASEESDELERSVSQVSPISGIDANDWYPLPPNNMALPLPGRTDSLMTDGKDQIDSEDREHAAKSAGESGTALRRAKNRSAASKCRAKQRKNAKGLQEAYEENSSQNAYLKRQERMLRGLITTLRDCALQHDSTRCRCTSLHAFNRRRAEQISRAMDSSDRCSIV